MHNVSKIAYTTICFKLNINLCSAAKFSDVLIRDCNMPTIHNDILCISRTAIEVLTSVTALSCALNTFSKASDLEIDLLEVSQILF